MISGVRSSQIWQEGELIHLRLNFEEGLEREYVYHVVPVVELFFDEESPPTIPPRTRTGVNDVAI